MKIAVIIVRSLLGLMFLAASIPYFLHLIKMPVLTGNVKTFMEGINASIYLMPTIKGFELLCGLLFISGRFTSLAAVIIFPIILNIVLYDAFLVTKDLPMALILLLADLFLAWYYRKNYAAMFVAKS